MLILAFDTSTSKGGVAVLRDDQFLCEKTWSREGSHGELLTPALQECLESAGLKTKDLDALAIGHGPGSFTGVRVTVNAARALAYALNLPVYVFDTTEIIAEAVNRHDYPVAVLINAHKNLIFASTFEWENGLWRRKVPLAAYELNELGSLITSPHLALGDAFDEFAPSMDQALLQNLVRDPELSDEPNPVTLGLMAYKRRDSIQPLDWKNVQALYIRPSGAEENLRKGEKK